MANTRAHRYTVSVTWNGSGHIFQVPWVQIKSCINKFVLESRARNGCVRCSGAICPLIQINTELKSPNVGYCALCRFSDAGDDEAGHRLEDRRLKSAEARNRGKWGHGRCRGLYGDLTAASVGRGWSERPPNCFASQDGCG